MSDTREPQRHVQCLDAVVRYEGGMLRIEWGDGGMLVSPLERCRHAVTRQHGLNLWTLTLTIVIGDTVERPAPWVGAEVCLVVAQGWQTRAELFVRALLELAERRAGQGPPSLPEAPEPEEEAVYVPGSGDVPPPPSYPSDGAEPRAPADDAPVGAPVAVEEAVGQRETSPRHARPLSEPEPEPGLEPVAEAQAEVDETAGVRDEQPAFARVPRTEPWLNLTTDHDSADLYQSILPLLNASD